MALAPLPAYAAQSHRQDLFSVAYVRAVAAAAGCAVSVPEPDNDKIDVTISSRASGSVYQKPKLDIQVKCEASGAVNGNSVPYVVDIATYDSLRSSSLVVPRILVVVLVPDDMQHWLDHSDAEMSFRHCGYWMSLKGSPSVSNQSDVTLHLPATNRFDPFQLQAMMQHVADGLDLTAPIAVGGTVL